MERRKLIIIGSGPAGWTAALYAARAGLAPLVVTGPQPGGQLTITDDVENYPGFPTPVGGQALMTLMEEQALRYGAEMVADIVVAVDFSKRPFYISGEESSWLADAVIVATGAKARWLDAPGADTYFGRGLSYCAVCDSYSARGKEVAVVGGGNTAVEEALYLSNFASRVHLIHRRDTLRAERILQSRLFENSKIKLHWNTKVAEIVGTPGLLGGMTHLRLASAVDGSAFDLPVSMAFGAIGHDPATGIFRGQIDMDEAGYVKVGNWSTRTSVDGVWAVGDVLGLDKQAVLSAGMGCMAALDVERWLGGH